MTSKVLQYATHIYVSIFRPGHALKYTCECLAQEVPYLQFRSPWDLANKSSIMFYCEDLVPIPEVPVGEEREPYMSMCSDAVVQWASALISQSSPFVPSVFCCV